MSLTGTFNPSTKSGSADHKQERRKRRPPFSIRLSEAEQARLVAEAKGSPLGTYIKAKLLGTTPVRMSPSRGQMDGQ